MLGSYSHDVIMYCTSYMMTPEDVFNDTAPVMDPGGAHSGMCLPFHEVIG